MPNETESESEKQNNPGFDEWKSKLARVNVDGVEYFVVHGDELRDESEVRALWERLQSDNNTESRLKENEKPNFYDVSPDTRPAGEPPKHDRK